ncbi:MAG: monovalent cation/H(+) antiporter subunit G [Pseudomonadota bacterium]
MSVVLDLLAALCLVLGGFLAFAAALGLIRMPDVYIRMHASTKAGTLGVLLIVLSIVFLGGEASVVGKGLAVFAFILLTAPIGAHLIGRSAYRCGIKPWDYRSDPRRR